LAQLLRTEEWRKFTWYTPKNRKTRQYLNDVEALYLSQNKVFSEFWEIVKRICYLQYNIFIQSFYSFDEASLLEVEKSFISRWLKFTDELKKSFLDTQIKLHNKSCYL
jgi:hypothetical protein